MMAYFGGIWWIYKITGCSVENEEEEIWLEWSIERFVNTKKASLECILLTIIYKLLYTPIFEKKKN